MENNNWNTDIQAIPFNDVVQLTIDTGWVIINDNPFRTCYLKAERIVVVAVKIETSNNESAKYSIMAENSYKINGVKHSRRRITDCTLLNKYIYAWQPMPQPYQP